MELQPESALSHLECPLCGRRHEADILQNLCHGCGKPLLARYDLAAAARTLTLASLPSRPRSLWRWAEVLPVRDPTHRLTLGEGSTPLVPAPRLGEALGLPRLLVKDEGLNPTTSFKARGMAAAVARARELGAT
ncbi:MAG: pyridoxal-phosphate dependent enzyme, partial [Thiobacillus sp.]|nr:pyridoxal-phosphate dependent enzyme [Thiobacillus sp.]